MRLKKKIVGLLAVLCCCASFAFASTDKTESIELTSSKVSGAGLLLPVDNAFSGIVDGSVIVAGGVDSLGNVSDVIVVSEGGNAVSGGKLPAGVYDGASVTTSSGLICAGGRNSTQCVADVTLIKINDGNVTVEELPALPTGLAGATGVADGNKVWVCGGYSDISGKSYSPVLYMLDLKSTQSGWREISRDDWAARRNAAAVIQSNGVSPCIYIIGGKDVSGNPDGVASYDIQLNRWKHVELNVPEGIVAAIPMAANHIFAVRQDHSGGSRSGISLLKYHTVTNTAIDVPEVRADGVVLNIGKNNNGFTVLAAELMGVDLMLLNATVRSSGEGLSAVSIIVIFLYFAILAGIGVYFSRRQKTTDDYFKGGGRIPWWAAGLSLFGTALSAITFMAIPAKAYATDWSYALFNVGILLVAPVIVYLFIPYFRKLNITTAYEYLEIRFNAAIRVICSLAFIVFQIGRMGVVLFLPAIALNVVTGIDIFMCIGIMGVCSILYTMIGGIEAVVWTDAIQVLILLGGALFAVIYIACELPGGMTETISIAAAHGKFGLGSTALDLKDATVWTVLIATCFTNLTTYGTDQSMVQRYLTTPSMKAARKSVWTNAIITMPATVLFFLIGTALYSYYTVYPENLSVTIPNGDAIFPWYIFTELPAAVVGLLVSGIFAAAMSTLSGSMNSAATAFIVDIYPRICRSAAASSLRSARISTLVIGTMSLTFAVLMATWDVASLWDEFQKILGLILGCMGGLFVLGMLTRRANSSGAVIGIVVSMAVQFFVARFHTFHLLLYTASGFITCFVVGYVASFFFPAAESEDK